jgi:predicted enzyme related to lactoylglutathione lyase
MISKFKFFIFSEDPDKLLPFYRDVLGFTVISELKLPKDYGYMVEVAPGYEIWIAEHSEVKGKNKDPFRHILNLYPDDVEALFTKLKDYPGVVIIESLTSMKKFNPDADRKMFTILDPEGNCLQFMEPRS